MGITVWDEPSQRAGDRRTGPKTAAKLCHEISGHWLDWQLEHSWMWIPSKRGRQHSTLWAQRTWAGKVLYWCQPPQSLRWEQWPRENSPSRTHSRSVPHTGGCWRSVMWHPTLSESQHQQWIQLWEVTNSCEVWVMYWNSSALISREVFTVYE